MEQKVFLIQPDENYGSVNIVDYENSRNRVVSDFNGGEIGEWAYEEYYYQKQKFKKGDFFWYRGNLGLQRSGLEKVGEYLKKYGQLLPIEIEGAGKRYVFNVTQYCDCFDFDNSTYPCIKDEKFLTVTGKEGRKIYEDINKFSITLTKADACLNASKITYPLFYTFDRMYFMGPYITSGFFPKEEELYHIIIENEMKGYSLTEVCLS